MDGGVAPRRPASATTNKISVSHFADEELTGLVIGSVHLHVAFEAKIIVAFGEKLAVHRAVRVMANGAAFPHCFMLVNKGPRLFAMTLRALLVHARHRQAARRLHDFVSMRIMALHAIHPPFNHRMMLRKIEQRMHIQVALETGSRILARVDNESAASTDLHMSAGRPVARFATGHMREFDIILIEFAVCARVENSGDICVAIHA